MLTNATLKFLFLEQVVYSCGLNAKKDKRIVVSSYILSLLPVCLVSTPISNRYFYLSVQYVLLFFLPPTSFSPVIPISLHPVFSS